MASASVRPSFTTRSLSTMNGTPVFRAAWATVANCSALRKPSAATSMRAPRLSTGFSLACRRGSDAGTELDAAVAFTALDVSAFGAAAVALARGVRRVPSPRAGGVAFVAVALGRREPPRANCQPTFCLEPTDRPRCQRRTHLRIPPSELLLCQRSCSVSLSATHGLPCVNRMKTCKRGDLSK